MHQWEGFNMDEDWLITTKAGKRVLVIEADRYKQRPHGGGWWWRA